jgi:hypothetical protein
MNIYEVTRIFYQIFSEQGQITLSHKSALSDVNVFLFSEDAQNVTNMEII